MSEAPDLREQEEAAEHFADILRTNGHQHVTTHHLNSTETKGNHDA